MIYEKDEGLCKEQIRRTSGGVPMLTIRPIDATQYPNGKKVLYTYETTTFYKMKNEQTENGWMFTLQEQPFPKTFVKHLEEELFEEYKEGSDYYVADWNGEEAAVLVVQQMEWNNTLLIHNLYVYESFKRMGIGSKMMEFVKERALTLDVRAITLETQTSNYPAVQFYLKNGFQLVGFNTISYSNEDVENGEVRLEMAYIRG